MKTLMLSCLLILICEISGSAQGTFIYRTGSEIASGKDIDLNLDGTVDFDFIHTGVNLGDELIRLYSLAPRTTFDLFPDFAGEVMQSTTPPTSISWSEGQPILADPGPGTRWTSAPLNMSHQLVAIRVRNGEDWHYGWMRFEVVGQDVLGDLWGLRDAAYNGVPNAPINMLQVPEPSIWLLLTGGGLALFALKRRHRPSI